MQYNETQLAAIKLFGDKTLSFGCLLNVGFPEVHYVKVIARLRSNSYKICNHHRNSKYEGMQDIVEYKDNFSVERTPIEEITEILGHEPHLFPDVARVAEANDMDIYLDIFPDHHELIIYGDTKEANIVVDPFISLLDQPNLSEIVNLFSK